MRPPASRPPAGQPGQFLCDLFVKLPRRSGYSVTEGADGRRMLSPWLPGDGLDAQALKSCEVALSYVVTEMAGDVATTAAWASANTAALGSGLPV